MSRLTATAVAGANVHGAHLLNTDLIRAIANTSTVWPEGFDPVAAGVIID